LIDLNKKYNLQKHYKITKTLNKIKITLMLTKAAFWSKIKY